MANRDKNTLEGNLPGKVIFGVQGKSAYDIAVENGYEGTIFEWLESLVGPPGEPTDSQVKQSVYEYLDENQTMIKSYVDESILGGKW